MKYLSFSIIVICYFSCKNFEYEKTEKQGVILKQYKKLIADDFSIPNDFLEAAPDDKISEHKLEYKELISMERKWFTNSEQSQTIAIELYTDKHRLRTHYFDNKDVPLDLINEMTFLSKENGEFASNLLKQKYFKGFIGLADVIEPNYFKSNKSFVIGSNIGKAIETYGLPHQKLSIEGIDKLHWKFEGDVFALATKENLVEDSFGHEVTMYFRNDKLIGMVLYNAIP